MANLTQHSTLNRRRFLVGASAAGLAAAELWRGRAAAQTAAGNLAASAWAELANALSGGVLVRPGEPDYLRLSSAYNLAYPTPLPAGIARCVSRENVQAAIRWCRKHAVRPVARSGGHSYAGFSMTDGLMIETGGIAGAAYDPRTRQVWIGGGVRNAAINDLLRTTDAAITHGRCPTVGAAGFLLGGGIGFNMRSHGVGVDQLAATELVTADGEFVVASRSENAELFWACRGGGGGNFGINTGFLLQAYQVAPVTIFKLQWAFDGPDPLAVANAVLASFTDAPNGLGSRMSVQARQPGGPAQQIAIDLIGQFSGKPAELHALLAPVFALGPRVAQQIETLPYWAAQDALKEHDPPFRFHERSAFLARRLDEAALRTAHGFLSQWPGTAGHADLRFFQTGGVMNTPPEDTAFVHRGSKWLMDVGSSWGADDTAQRVAENVAWQNDFYAAMLRHGTGGAYQNFIDPAEDNWAEAYYGKALPRLRAVKRKVDPGNIFNFAQSIRPG